MSISIITPHYNYISGLKTIYECLKLQSVDQWEWVIVDDGSDAAVQEELLQWHASLSNNAITLIQNKGRSNASVCRNKGAVAAIYDRLLFLDADDSILPEFIKNRCISVHDFTVFPNFAIVDKDEKIVNQVKDSNYLECFLSGRFIWQTSSILWEKAYFNKIGGFNEKLPRLQDVELSIRALQHSSDYTVLDNPVDFHYHVKPIRERKNILKPVCDAVYIFISELIKTTDLKGDQKKLLKGYYYMCVKYLERLGSVSEVDLVHRNLKLFYDKGYIKGMGYVAGRFLLYFYKWKWISADFFLKVNRKLFKP